jgi:hypothetical protein
LPGRRSADGSLSRLGGAWRGKFKCGKGFPIHRGVLSTTRRKIVNNLFIICTRLGESVGDIIHTRSVDLFSGDAHARGTLNFMAAVLKDEELKGLIGTATTRSHAQKYLAAAPDDSWVMKEGR